MRNAYFGLFRTGCSSTCESVARSYLTKSASLLRQDGVCHRFITGASITHIQTMSFHIFDSIEQEPKWQTHFGRSRLLFRKDYGRTLHGAHLLSKRHQHEPIIRGKPSVPLKRNINIPFSPLNVEQLRKVFCNILEEPQPSYIDIPEKEGNIILRILHQRRVTGSLVDLGVEIKNATVPRENIVGALSWLREQYPIDEQAAARNWANKELQKVEDNYINRAVELGLYRPLEGNKGNVSHRDASHPEIRTDTSVIEEFKRYHEERRKREEEEREKSGEKHRAEQKEEEMRLAKFEEKEKRDIAREEHRKKQDEQGRISERTEPIQSSKFQKLLPSTTFSVCAFVCIFYAAYTYNPPPESARLFADLPTSVATCVGIAMLTTSITCLWYIPLVQRFLNTYFLVVPAEPVFFSMLGNIFSHQRFIHLLSNLAVLFLYGIPLHEDVGRANFMAIFLCGGIFGSVFSLYRYVLKGILYTTHCGSSGGMWALMSAWAYYNVNKPKREVMDYAFLVDAGRWSVFALQLPTFFVQSVRNWIDVFSHAGGFFAGLLIAMGLHRTSSDGVRHRLTRSNQPSQQYNPHYREDGEG